MRARFASLLALAAALGDAPAARADGGPADAGADAQPADAGPSQDGGAPAKVVAAPCPEDPYRCATAPIVFDKTNVLPGTFSYDTGWVPPAQDVQVRFVAELAASTRVRLAGALRTSFPETLTLRTPGDEGGGLLAFDYGLTVAALGKIDVVIAGQSFKWQGKLPYAPNVDFRVKGSATFDAWGFPPGASAKGKTPKPVPLAKISVTQAIIGSIPGIDGGFELEAGAELEVCWRAERIVVEPADAPIATQNGAVHASFGGGAWAEFDVHPEGTVCYLGTIDLIPAFYFDLLGKHFAIPIVTIPVQVPKAEVPWSFAAVRVHVPLADVRVPALTIDFGAVPVGKKVQKTVPIENAGEAAAHLDVVSGSAAFVPFSSTMDVSPGATQDLPVAFAPAVDGVVETALTVLANDPDQPLQTVKLRGRGIGPAADAGQGADAGVGADGGEAAAAGVAEEQGGCACRAGRAARGGDPAPGAGAVLAALCALAGRRVRAGSRCRRTRRQPP